MTWLDPRQWLLIALFCAASVAGYSFWSARLTAAGYDAGYAKAQTDIRQAQAAAADRARVKERRLQQAVDAARKERDHAMDRLRAEHAVDVARLRERADRPASDSPSTTRDGQAATGCTGAELYRQDAEFLVGESYRAEATRLGLLACYAQYEQIRGEVNGGP